ncbi:TlpA family protein disulfide reductase [Formosa haliotis]|uniref:TlpA family protein disulfide reductase n=1 Tax=Formosa haliotis TaxID=1555194 RepID=UPI000824A078|nr:TlpA disulfide reductase family protein [Formosa haliotis]
MKKILFALFILPTLMLAQHKISGTFTPAASYKAAILYKLNPSNNEYISNADIVNGQFELDLDATLKPGMYRIVYALPQEQYNFNFIYNNEDVVFNYDQQKGVSFLTSKENQILNKYKSDMFAIKSKINSFYGQPNQDESEYMDCIAELTAVQDQAEKESKGMIANHFIVAEKPYIPTTFEDAPTYFNNFKKHYFKPINFSDPVLQNSSFLMDSAMSYVFIFVDKDDKNTSYKNNIDDVVRVTSKEKVIQKSILEVLWTQFKERQNEEVANYIASKYLQKLLDPVKDEMLITDMKAFQNTAIGATAPDFSWPSKVGSTKLSQLSGKDFYIVTFWSSTCSHCLAELPVLKAYLKDKPNIQVLAIGLEDERPNWENTIKNYTEFTQIYGHGKWDNPIPIAYGVSGTPSFFVLDKNKKIIAKPDDVEKLKAFLDTKL